MVKFKPGTCIRHQGKGFTAIGIIAGYYEADGIRHQHYYQVKWLHCTTKLNLPILIPGPHLEMTSQEDEQARMFFNQE